MHKEQYHRYCSTLEEFDDARLRQKTARPGQAVTIFLVCQKDHFKILPHEKKIAIPGRGIFCQKHAFEIVKALHPSLQEDEFERQSIQIRGSGVHGLYLYLLLDSAPASVPALS